jgi:DNA-binding transcriptional LysR family regulator
VSGADPERCIHIDTNHMPARREPQLTLAAQQHGPGFVQPVARLQREDGRALQVNDIVELAKYGREWLNGTIRLGVLPTLGPYLLPYVLPELHQSYPGLRLYVREGMPSALINGLEDGDLDLLLFPLPVKEADVAEDLARPARDLLPDRGQDHLGAPAALDQLRPEAILELPDLATQGRLTDVATLGGTPEVQRFRQRH